MVAAKNLTTLIVDDSRSMRVLVRQSLQAIGIVQVIECEDGEEALSVLKTHSRSLIISDLNMPKLDGLGLLKAVRAEPSFAATAFIMLTSRGDAGLVQEAIKLGVNNYLIKPFTIDALKKKIESVVGPLT